MTRAAKFGVALVLFCGALTIFETRGEPPLFLNTTSSEPEGLYAVVYLRPQRLALGEYVAACPPLDASTATARARGYLAEGNCPGKLIPVLKQVAAVPGDIVQTGPAGVAVNGAVLPNTAPLAQDEKGRLLAHYPFGIYHVPERQIWLISTYASDSYDARYFGPVTSDAVRAIVKPVWIKK